MPSLLKKHIENQNYDFPDIRELDIQNVNIKYHQNARSHGFNDSLLITIG